MRMSKPMVLMAAASLGMVLATAASDEEVMRREQEPKPKEPPPEVAAEYTERQLREARKARIADGATDIPEADRARLEAAQAKRDKKAARRR